MSRVLMLDLGNSVWNFLRLGRIPVMTSRRVRKYPSEFFPKRFRGATFQTICITFTKMGQLCGAHLYSASNTSQAIRISRMHLSTVPFAEGQYGVTK